MASKPIILIVFNRPELTRRVFERVRLAQPRELFVVADGPRPGHPADASKCSLVREIVAQVDWDCTVHRDYADTNMGCGRRVSSGITNGLSQLGEAIILEDDCVPDMSFFRFCDELLESYRNDERVMSISGTNYQGGIWRGSGSYYFSKYPQCWGWATWRSAWESFDLRMQDWPEFRSSRSFHEVCREDEERTMWSGIFDRVVAGEIDTWDIQWMHCCWKNGGLTVIPNQNLVENVGFGSDATHTMANDHWTAPQSTTMDELFHPEEMTCDENADWLTFETVFRPPGFQPTVSQAIRMKFGAIRRSVMNAVFSFFSERSD
jgi:hypothetical protein